MSEILEQCQKANAHLKIQTLQSPAFASLGRVHAYRFPKIKEYLKTLPMEDFQGFECYTAEDPRINEFADEAELIRNNLYGQVPCQIGSYTGRAFKLNALEYHHCSEILYLVTDAVLLLGHIWDLNDFCLDTSSLQAFFVPTDTCVELYATTLHFSPLAATSAGVRQAVVQQQATNTPILHEVAIKTAEDKLLLERNKWVLCHEEASEMFKGKAFVGLSGPNTQLNLI